MTKFQIGDLVRWKSGAGGGKPFVLPELFSGHYLRQMELIGRHGFKIGDRVNAAFSAPQLNPGRVVGFDDDDTVQVFWKHKSSGWAAFELRHEPWPADPVLAAGLKAIVDFLAGVEGVLYYPPLRYHGPKAQTPYAKWEAGRVSVDPERAFIAGWNAAERNARQVANRDTETLKRIAALIRERS